MLGELLSELAEGQAEEEDARLVEAVSLPCRHMQTRLLELVAVVRHRSADQISVQTTHPSSAGQGADRAAAGGQAQPGRGGLQNTAAASSQP